MHIANVLAFTTPGRAAAMSILRFAVQMYFSSLSPRGGRPVASGNAYIRPLDSTSEEQYLVKFGASKACGGGGPVIVILFEDTLGVLADPANYVPEMYVLTPKGDDRGAYGYEHESEEESDEEEGTEEAEEASAGVAGVAVDVDAEFEMADADEPAPVPRRLSFAQRRITPSTRSDRQVMSLAWDQHWAAGKFLRVEECGQGWWVHACLPPAPMMADASLDAAVGGSVLTTQSGRPSRGRRSTSTPTGSRALRGRGW